MAKICDRGNVSVQLSDLVTVLETNTPHGQAKFYRHPTLGRVLVLNGEIQHVEAWAPLYHEPLVHLPAAFVKTPRTALIVGGGSFFAAKEVLRYRSIQRVLMLDYDEALLDAVTRVYEETASIRADPRMELKCVDAFCHLPQVDETFDLIINDSVDLLSVSQGFEMLTGLLTPHGVCSDVMYRHLFESDTLDKGLRLLPASYERVLSLIFVPEYPGLLHLLMMWSRSAALSQRRKKTLNEEQIGWCSPSTNNPCSYFDPHFLSYYLYLPRWIREKIAAGTIRGKHV